MVGNPLTAWFNAISGCGLQLQLVINSVYSLSAWPWLAFPSLPFCSSYCPFLAFNTLLSFLSQGQIVPLTSQMSKWMMSHVASYLSQPSNRVLPLNHHCLFPQILEEEDALRVMKERGCPPPSKSSYLFSGYIFSYIPRNKIYTSSPLPLLPLCFQCF